MTNKFSFITPQVKLRKMYKIIIGAGYPQFGKYLNNTGRPMVYSCSWPAYQEEKGMLVSI